MSSLVSQIATRGDQLQEIKHASRSTNQLIRSHYATFIHDVGRNVYPLIVFTDHEEDGLDGVGSTLTLYRADGSSTKVTPALNSNYEIYKSASHVFMGLGVEVGPYLENDTVCSGSMTAIDDESNDDVELTSSRALGVKDDTPWRASLTEFVQRIRIFRQAIYAAEEDSVVNDVNNLEIEKDEEKKDEGDMNNLASNEEDDTASTSYGRWLEMRETMLAMLTSAIDYCEECLKMGVLDVRKWEQLNQSNFPRIKECMIAATAAQADACVRTIVKWRDMMGPTEWRDLYVVIPTVWAVGQECRKSS